MKKYFTLLLISLIGSPLFSNVLVPSQEQMDYIMELMNLIWGQGSFTTSQMKILRTISAYLNLSQAERRFTV